MDSRFVRVAMEDAMVSSMLLVSPPFHSHQLVTSSKKLSSRLCMMSATRRWEIFWMVHWRKMRSLVWRSGTPFSRAATLQRTSATYSSKNDEAKVGDPTGVPRGQKPSVSSTGMLVKEAGELFLWRIL